MPVPCPCCKAANDAGPNCRRCKADLSLLFAIDDERTQLVARARELTVQSRFPDSLACLDRAAQLRAGDDVRRARAAVLLLARAFPAALAAYHDLRSASRET